MRASTAMRYPPIATAQEPQPAAAVEGVRRLCCAILLDAIDIRRRNLHRDQKQIARDAEWALDQATGPFSFTWLCDNLGLPVSTMRRGFLSLTRGQRAWHTDGREAPTTTA